MQTPKVKMRMRPPFEILTQAIPGFPLWLSRIEPVSESLLCGAPPHAALLVSNGRIELDERDRASIQGHASSLAQPCPSPMERPSLLLL
jgi:hypothetical protein